MGQVARANLLQNRKNGGIRPRPVLVNLKDVLVAHPEAIYRRNCLGAGNYDLCRFAGDDASVFKIKSGLCICSGIYLVSVCGRYCGIESSS